MMGPIPPNFLLEFLAQLQQSQQEPTGLDPSLFAAPMMPQGPSNPFDLGSIQNPYQYQYEGPNPNGTAGYTQLSDLERQLSEAMTSKDQMEAAAFQGGRPDLFVNQAINDPTNAQGYLTKAKLTQDETIRRESETERDRAFQASQEAEQRALYGQLTPTVGPELAQRFAEKAMKNEPLNDDDINAWKMFQYQQADLAFEKKKREDLIKMAGDFKVTALDYRGDAKEVPYDPNNPEHVEKRRRFLEDMNVKYNEMKPAPPQLLQQTQAQSSKPELRNGVWYNEPETPTALNPKPGTGTTPEGPPPPTPAKKPPTVQAKGEERETLGGALSRQAKTIGQRAWEAGPISRLAELFGTPTEDLTAGNVLGSLASTIPIVGAGSMLAAGGGGLGEELIAGLGAGPQTGGVPPKAGAPKTMNHQDKVQEQLLTKSPGVVIQEILASPSLTAQEKQQLVAWVNSRSVNGLR